MAGARAGRGDVEILRRVAHIDEPPVMGLCRLRQGGDVTQPTVQAGGNVEAGGNGGDHQACPVVGESAAARRHADHQCFGAALHGCRNGQFFKSDIGAAAGEANLPDAPFGPPMGDARCRLA